MKFVLLLYLVFTFACARACRTLVDLTGERDEKEKKEKRLEEVGRGKWKLD